MPKDPDPPKEPEPEPPTAESQPPAPGQGDDTEATGELVDDGQEPAASGGKVSISIDQLARPGMLVSGKVTFSDQQSAGWYLDQFGQLGMSPDQEGYKPSQTDLMEFQMALQSELSRKGF